MVISQCNHRLEGDTVAKLEACVKEFYLDTAYWIKFRHEWFKQRSDLSAVHIAYENMMHCPIKEMAKIVRVAVPGAKIKGESIADIARATSADKLRKYMNEGNGLWQIRAAGSKNYTQYGLSDDITSWMDTVYDALDLSGLIKARTCTRSSKEDNDVLVPNSKVQGWNLHLQK